MARPGLREEVTFEVNIARLAGISQEIREGGTFQEEGTVFLGQSVRDGDKGKSDFAKEILEMNPHAFHITF